MCCMTCPYHIEENTAFASIAGYPSVGKRQVWCVRVGPERPGFKSSLDWRVTLAHLSVNLPHRDALRISVEQAIYSALSFLEKG